MENKLNIVAFFSRVSPACVRRLVYRVFFRRRDVTNKDPFIEAVRGLRGLEIGGPSMFFDLSLPLYRHADSVDGANFSRDTLWEGQINSAEPYEYLRNRFGRQFILEATNLSEIEDGTYGFVLSCHSLEHVANPLKALREWHRVLQPHGHLVIAVPNKDAIFDHRRAVTPFSHLQQDEESETDEADLTHLAEILELHDLKRDKAAGTRDEFMKRSLDNAVNRGLHHHVFDSNTLMHCIEHVGFSPTLVHTSYYDHLLLCRKN